MIQRARDLGRRLVELAVALILAAGMTAMFAGVAEPGAPVPPPGAPNPEVTQATIAATICRRGWTASIRPPVAYTDALKRKQLAASHAADQDPAHYEEDHLIPLALGGHPTSEQNLWPQPLAEAVVKDQDEDRLHRAVCAGTLTLDEARQQIRDRWGGHAPIHHEGDN